MVNRHSGYASGPDASATGTFQTYVRAPAPPLRSSPRTSLTRTRWSSLWPSVPLPPHFTPRK